MSLFRFSKKEAKQADKTPLSQSLERIETQIRETLEEKQSARKWGRFLGSAALGCVAVVFITKAVVLLEALPILVLGYGVSKFVERMKDKSLNEKYQIQAELLTAAENANKPAAGLEPAAPKNTAEAGVAFDNAARIAQLEKEIAELKVKPVDLEKPVPRRKEPLL